MFKQELLSNVFIYVLKLVNLNKNGSAKYIEKLFRLMEITFGQDNDILFFLLSHKRHLM